MNVQAIVVSLLGAAALAVSGSAHAQTGVRISLPICDSSAMPSNFQLREAEKSPDKKLPWAVPFACGTSPFDCLFSFSMYPGTLNAFTQDTLDWGGGNVAYYVQR